jgi:hypothetical protein
MAAVQIQKRDIVRTKADPNDRTQGLSTVFHYREKALALPSLERHLPAIVLGLSDPNFQVRLFAARKLAKRCEESYVAHKTRGLSSALEIVFQILESPQVFFRSKDPRLDNKVVYDPDKAAESIRLGVLMAIQQISRMSSFTLRLPLANFFKEQGLFTCLKGARQDKAFLQECINTHFAIPSFERRRNFPLEYLFDVLKYAVAVAALESSWLRQKFFPEVGGALVGLATNASTRNGLLYTIAPLALTVIENEKSLKLRTWMQTELDQIVGQLTESRLISESE